MIERLESLDRTYLFGRNTCNTWFSREAIRNWTECCLEQYKYIPLYLTFGSLVSIQSLILKVTYFLVGNWCFKLSETIPITLLFILNTSDLKFDSLRKSKKELWFWMEKLKNKLISLMMVKTLTLRFNNKADFKVPQVWLKSYLII